jgi:hypothetical protein
MHRDVALRIDGVVSGLRSQLDWLANLARSNLDEDEYKEIIAHVGAAMGAIYHISSKIYDEFPDAIPSEMRPSEGKTS